MDALHDDDAAMPHPEAWAKLLERIQREQQQRQQLALVLADQRARERRFSGQPVTGFGGLQ